MLHGIIWIEFKPDLMLMKSSPVVGTIIRYNNYNKHD